MKPNWSDQTRQQAGGRRGAVFGKHVSKCVCRRPEWFRTWGHSWVDASVCPVLWVIFPVALPVNGLASKTAPVRMSCLQTLQSRSQFDGRVLCCTVYVAVYATVHRGINIHGVFAHVYTKNTVGMGTTNQIGDTLPYRHADCNCKKASASDLCS